MRLTADLIQNSLSYINPVLERELDLRGHKIPLLENLGAAHPTDCIDLTDNHLTHLPALPLSPRLRTLLLARNRVASIAPSFAATAPNVTTLVLTGNRLARLADLEPLRGLRRLETLVLLECPVARADAYREWVVWRLGAALRFLDFQRVTQAERERAAALFGDDEENMTDRARQILSEKSAVAVGGGRDAEAVNGDGSGRVKLTAKERKKVELMIRNAKSLAEIERLEKELNQGRVPGGVLDGEDDDDDMED